MMWNDTARGDRLDPVPGDDTMKAIVTMRVGGYEVLERRIVRRPRPADGEVLLRVLAAGVNNTEINTRVGWYSANVSAGTEDAAPPETAASDGDGPAIDRWDAAQRADGGWNAVTPFPFIQGTDCCGTVVASGPGVGGDLVGQRVLVRPCMRVAGFESMENVWMGSDSDGAFAQYVAVPAGEVFPVECGWSDVELGSIPCAYGTAENLLHRAAVRGGLRVLVTGASGGVGSAAVQLARRRGAEVVAVAGRAKHDAVRGLGAAVVLDREADLVEEIGEESVDVVIDAVGGAGFGDRLRALRRGGRYATSGAIAGPLVELDLRTMYLKDLTLIGATAWDEPVFPSLVEAIERDEIRPLVAATYPLEEIATAQRDFLTKRHVGKFVLIPPVD